VRSVISRPFGIAKQGFSLIQSELDCSIIKYFIDIKRCKLLFGQRLALLLVRLLVHDWLLIGVLTALSDRIIVAQLGALTIVFITFIRVCFNLNLMFFVYWGLFDLHSGEVV
jgi:hypothetical protein